MFFYHRLWPFSPVQNCKLSVRKNYENLRQAWAKCLIILSQTSKLMVEHISSFKLKYINKKLCFSIIVYGKIAAFSLIDSYILSVRKNYENLRQAWAKCQIILSQTCKLMVEHISSFKLMYFNKNCVFLSSLMAIFTCTKLQTFCKKKL